MDMGSADTKPALFEAIAVMGKAFASPRRLELLDLLAQAPRTVDDLAQASGQSNANTSQHLQALHAAGMVTRAREGNSVRYSLAGDEVLSLWLALRNGSPSSRHSLGPGRDLRRRRRPDRSATPRGHGTRTRARELSRAWPAADAYVSCQRAVTSAPAPSVSATAATETVSERRRSSRPVAITALATTK